MVGDPVVRKYKGVPGRAWLPSVCMEINGLPLHPLVVHAVVVLSPLAALGGLLYAAVPRWRWWLRWPLVQVLWISFTEPEPGLGNYERLLTNEAVQRVWVTTLRICVITTTITHRRNSQPWKVQRKPPPSHRLIAVDNVQASGPCATILKGMLEANQWEEARGSRLN